MSLVGDFGTLLAAAFGLPPPAPSLTLGPICARPAHADAWLCEPADVEAWLESGAPFLPGEDPRPLVASALNGYNLRESGRLTPAQRTFPGARCVICAELLDETDEIVGVPLCG